MLTFVDVLKNACELPNKITEAKLKFTKIKNELYYDQKKWLDLQFQLRPKLLSAIGRNDMDAVIQCVALGADPNFGGHCFAPNTNEYVTYNTITLNVDSITPLHMAIIQTHALPMAKLILDLGAKIESANHYSKIYWNQSLINLLHMNQNQEDLNQIEQLKRLLGHASKKELIDKNCPTQKRASIRP